MATQRVTPRELVAQNLTFTYNGSALTVNNPGYIINQGDQVTFANASASTAPINITFSTGPQPPNLPPNPALFQNMQNIQPGGNQVQFAPQLNGSVNYTVTAGGQNFGPYVIQVGTGPIYIKISGSSPSPTPLAVPNQGMLAMFSTDVTYYLQWTAAGGNPFPTPSPGLTTVYQATPTSNPNIAYQEKGVGALFGYAISTTPPSAEHEKSKPIEITKDVPRTDTGSGGRVIIQNS